MVKSSVAFLVSIMAIGSTLVNYCPWGNTPVCGVDNVTYPNQCALQAAYVQLQYVGGCNKVIDRETGEIQSNCD